MSPFDRLLLRRCLLLAVLLFGMTVAVVVATDEPGSTLGMRVARLSALLPALAVSAEILTLEQARARGELAALEALGGSPWRVTRGARVAGLLLAGVAIGCVASRYADARALFPVLTRSNAWLVTAAGLTDPGSGVSVSADGSILLARAGTEPAVLDAPGQRAALYCIAPLSLVAPLWGATRQRLAARLPIVAASGAAAIVLLHAVAQARVPAATLALAALPLGAQALYSFLKRSPA